ncbi:acetyltransferase [Bordetella pertussis]|nr:acetyltransferase [Bordetella pertussis]
MPHTLDERKRWLALMVLCLGVLMIVLDTTIVNVALPSIKADLGFTEASLVWVVNAYMLTFGCFLLLGGRLGDLLGQRRMFLAGLPAITLTTFRDLPWNQPFYARLGFATLQADGLNVRLQAILAREASLGLPAARRCAMRREIAAARR